MLTENTSVLKFDDLIRAELDIVHYGKERNARRVAAATSS